FGWTHVTLLIIVTQSHLIMQNIFEGLIWFLVPVSMIICNDIMAYLFGFFFGRTPLIKLSPKKTWEGFIGGAFATILFGILASYMLVQFDYFVCPIEYDDAKQALSMDCERFVFIIGCGPCGLRMAIESALLGCQVTVVDKRDGFTRNNVLHLWTFLIHDLKSLAAKQFFGKFCSGSIDHIS
ncbi:hypothetical protein HELRODRAFT_184518, partial [Helobdella robusta]|uniref:phosphatidate cytidylyltransferase n=1 Tax=Helobdella robusta TaxID=6412 RepID=T1FLD7_HELRO